jgi:uncharacterized membrane protein YccC
MQHPSASPSAFLLIAAASSLGWHFLVKRYGRAVIGAALTAVVLFRVVSYLVLGYLDPYFLVATVTSTIPAFAIAAVVGLPFRILRARDPRG